MRRRAFTFWQIAILLVALAILATVLMPVFERFKISGHRSSCQSNLKQIGLGVWQYIRDWDESYPRVNAGEEGWMDGIMPYIRERRLFHCPSETKGRLEGTSDYFYNTRMSGRHMDKVNYPASTIMNGDGIGESRSNVSLPQLPQG